MKIKFTPLRFITRGFGGPAAVILAGGLLTLPIIVNDIRRVLGSSERADEIAFDDDINTYRITAMLTEINRRPLDNVLYNKMSKLILEKKIALSVDLAGISSKKSDPYKIVIGEYKVKRET